MAGRSGGLLSASLIVVLTLGGTACDYDRSSAPNGQGYGDTAGMSAAEGRSDFRVFTATGDIAATVAEFRTVLGDPLNGGTPGPLSEGRREIKWDAAPAEMPGDFFNTVVKAGAIFTTMAPDFEQRQRFQRGQPGLRRRLQRVQPAEDVHAHRQRGADHRVQGAGLRYPGGDPGLRRRVLRRRATGAASIKLFDAHGRSLGQYHAPVRTDAAGFSFVGVVFDSPIVAEVRIMSGQRALGPDVQDLSDGGNQDLVVMDDYLYGEPQAIQ